MIKPSGWRMFVWEHATGLASYEGRTQPDMPASLLDTLILRHGYHGVPVELCMWKGKPIDDCPNVRRTEIELFPELKPRKVTHAPTVQSN